MGQPFSALVIDKEQINMAAPLEVQLRRKDVLLGSFGECINNTRIFSIASFFYPSSENKLPGNKRVNASDLVYFQATGPE